MIGLILLAGGASTRMGGITPKPFVRLGSKNIIDYSFEIFSSHRAINHIVVVIPPKYSHLYTNTAAPGPRRQDSVLNGLAKLPKECDTILIHDAARPFITHKNIDDLLTAGAPATLAIKTTSTIKQATPCGIVEKTLPRESLWTIQTPQLLTRTILEIPCDDDVTDDVALAERQGLSVQLVPGSPRNIKITYPEDLTIAESLLCATV